MKTKQRQRQNVVFAAFNTVAKIEHIKNKWIDFGLLVDMIQWHYVSAAIPNLDNKGIKSILTRSNMFNINNTYISNPLFDEEKDVKEEVSGGLWQHSDN